VSQFEPQSEQLLSSAVARHAAIVLCLPTSGLIRHFRTKFLCEDTDGIWVELVTAADSQLQELIAGQHLVAGSFHAGNNRITFLTTLVRVDPTYRLNDQLAVPAVCLRRPSDYRAIQRRDAYRVSVPADSELKVELWTIAEDADLNASPAAEKQLKAEIRDLSTGGIGVVLQKSAEPIAAGTRIRCEIKLQELGVLLQGRLRLEASAADASVSMAGVMFDNLEIDVKGRETLDTLGRMIQQLQRTQLASAS